MMHLLHSLGWAFLAYLFVGNTLRALISGPIYSVPDALRKKAMQHANVSMHLAAGTAGLAVFLLTL